MDSTEDFYHNERAPFFSSISNILIKITVICVLIFFPYSPFRVDLTLTFNGWPRYHLNVSLIGLNLNCQQAVSAEDLLVFAGSGDQRHGNKKKGCSLHDVTMEGTLELWHFTCECLLSPSCFMQFVFLTINPKNFM